jgi:signal transduction histidine kinase
VAVGFALLAFLLAGVLASASWVLVSSYVNRHQEATALAHTVDNALLLDSELRSGAAPSRKLVDRLERTPGIAALVRFDGRYYPNAAARQMSLPPDLGVDTSGRRAVAVRTTVDGHSFLVVGAPLQGAQNVLLELYPLFDLQHTLDTLGMVLLVGVVGAGFIGLVGGKFASRRMLKPLTDITSVAAAIAHGDLSARLGADTDPDLGSLARSFNRTAAALERRVHADIRFAGDVSHELRTPLTTMINSIVLLQNRRAELPADVVEPLDLLTEDLQRFRRLVVDLLDISRSDGGRDSLEPVVVADLVRRAADAAAGCPVTVIEPGAEATVLRADKRRLERVVANLVDNADVHGGGCNLVCVSRRNGSVRVQVDDHGRGVAEEHRERIFERFARVRSSHGPGVGLGLAIVAQHVHWHGGQVWVEDRPGGGARFVVQLPIRPEPRGAGATR